MQVRREIEETVLSDSEKGRNRNGNLSLVDMMRRLDALPEESWESLSVKAKRWNAQAAECFNKGGTIPPFPDELPESEVKLEGAKSPISSPLRSAAKDRRNYSAGVRNKKDDTRVVHLLTQHNPKKPGTLAFNRYAIMHEGLSVAEIKKDAENRPDLASANGDRKSWVSVDINYNVKKHFMELRKAPSNGT